MRYESGASFRRALEDRLRDISLQTGVPLVRLRKMVIFDRFLARLVQDQPDAWVVKGGVALQLRLANRARTTKDIDVLLTVPYPNLHQALVRAALLDLGDWFQFEVERPSTELPSGAVGEARFPVRGLIDGRRFETFHIDIGWGDPLVEPVENLATPALLDFADIPPTQVPCYPLTQQIAEKVHAYTRRHVAGESSRVRDLVDILLMAGIRQMGGRLLYQALQATFNARKTHPLPVFLPDPPTIWSAPFRRLAEQTGLDCRSLAEGGAAARGFLDPVLRGEATGTWNPVTWTWQPVK
jgi:predicted nucleotidyltransferase component of viral defense system